MPSADSPAVEGRHLTTLNNSGQSILGDQGIVIEFLKKNVAKEKPVMEVGHGFIVLGKLQEMSGNKKTLPDLLPEQATIRTRGRYEISIKLTT